MARAYAPLVLALLGATAQAADLSVAEHPLAACVDLRLAPATRSANLVTTTATLALKTPIGTCGCPSALATYTSSVTVNGVEQVLQEGLLGLRDGGQTVLVLASDPTLFDGHPARVALSCARSL